MSSNFNSFGNHGLNGVPYESPPGFSDQPFDYVFPDPQQFATGEVVLPAGATVEFDEFTDQGSIFEFLALEMPPPPNPGVTASYGYKATVQIYINEDVIFTDGLNTESGFGNQSQPLPIFPARYLAPGTLVRIVVTSFEQQTNYYNFAIVLRGIRRYIGAGGQT